MPLADRLRAARTSTRPFRVGAILAQWLSTLCAAAFGATHVGWRFEQGTDSFAAVQGAFRLVDGDLPREGSGLLWPIIARTPFSTVMDALNDRFSNNRGLGPRIHLPSLQSTGQDRPMGTRERNGAVVLDDVSKAIIEQLQEDGRRPYAAIGKAVGLRPYWLWGGDQGAI